MAIPSRVEAVAVLRALEPRDKLFNHCAVVGEVAAFLAAAMTRRGVAVNGPLIEAAALLHDLDKALPADDELRPLGHGAAGAEWLRRHGYDELADAVAAHPVYVLGDAASYEAWPAATTFETRVVAYADKRAIQEVVSLDARFERWYGRYPDSAMLPVAHERARELERDVCAAAGLAPEEVGRLSWVDAALAEGAAA
jgi:putative nucleotidyltransferase with HDIG domain